MSKENYTTINKYGKECMMPKTEGTNPEIYIASALDSIGIHQNIPNADGLIYVPQFFFDETGFRRMKYDFAILKNSEPKLLLEYDGEPHYMEQFYEDTGVRPERCTAHVIRTIIGETKKSLLAIKHDVPYVRINSHHIPHVRDLLISYIEIIVNEKDCLRNSSNEVIMIEMLEKYGWDFPYVSPSEPSKAEIEAIANMKM